MICQLLSPSSYQCTMRSGFAQMKKLWSASQGQLTSWFRQVPSNVGEYMLYMRSIIPLCSDWVPLRCLHGRPEHGRLAQRGLINPRYWDVSLVRILVGAIICKFMLAHKTAVSHLGFLQQVFQRSLPVMERQYLECSLFQCFGALWPRRIG